VPVKGERRSGARSASPTLVLARAAKAAKRQQALARAAEEEYGRQAEKRANEIANNLEP
jgi:hypothetical protein